MKRTVLLGLTFAGVAACGDNKGVDVDAAPIDAPIDVAIDAPIDTPPPVFSGSFSVIEAKLLNPGASTVFGQGLQLGLSFTDSSMVPAPLMEETPGAPIGCKVWEYTPAQAAASSVGIDEGTVTLSFTGGTTPATPPVVPTCAFTAGAGYTCADTATASGGGIVGAGPAAGLATLTDTDITYSAANSVGRYVRIAGAAMATNNGVFPIVAVGGANTLVYANPAFVAETLPAAATHINMAAVGPIPSAPDPGFLADDVALTVAHAAGGGNHVGNFSLATTAPGHIGDDFTLDAASTTLLNAIPNTGAAMTFTCATNCGAANAAGALVNIVTTDAPVAGMSPFAMPLPVTKRVQIRCASLGTGNITVPAAYAARLMTSGATRIQATYIRGALLSSTTPPVTGVAGHALVGFTTR